MSIYGAKTTIDQSNSSTVLADIVGLSFSIYSGITYEFEFILAYTSGSAGTGLKCGVTFPTATIFSGTVHTSRGVNGTGVLMAGQLTSSGDSVSATAVIDTSNSYLSTIKGTVKPTVDGTIQAQFANNSGAVVKTIKEGSCATLRVAQ